MVALATAEVILDNNEVGKVGGGGEGEEVEA